MVAYSETSRIVPFRTLRYVFLTFTLFLNEIKELGFFQTSTSHHLSPYSFPGCTAVLLLISDTSSFRVVRLHFCPDSAAGQARRVALTRRRRHTFPPEPQHVCQHSVAYQSSLLYWVRHLVSAVYQ